jgi:FkbM family methyltransferase
MNYIQKKIIKFFEIIKANLIFFLRSNLDWLVPRFLRLLDPLGRLSYSQEGEDLLIDRILGQKKSGFYVDVGAHHPKRFSNTYFFYKKGWTGINIEPNPSSVEWFDRVRPRDINLCVGVDATDGILSYYEFNDSALNTCDTSMVNERLKNTNYRLIAERKIRVERLESILRNNISNEVKIDFLSVDVEGLDLNVLKSNDWKLYRPRLVLVEALDCCLSSSVLSTDPVIRYMNSNGYELCAKIYNSYLFETPN